MNDDYYATLGLTSTASGDEIKAEIHKRIRAAQSDQHSTNTEVAARATAIIKELKEMRTILVDDDMRREYDGQLHERIVRVGNGGLAVELSVDDFLVRDSDSKGLPGAGYSIALVMDTSGSMGGQRLEDAKNAMHCFLDELTGVDNRVALVSFGCRTGVICPLTVNLGDIRDAVDSLTAENGTPLLKALNSTGDDIFPESTTESMIVIATDGHPSESQSEILSYASILKERGIRIIVIGIGSGVPEDFLKQLASSEGDYFFAKASVELKTIYKNISDGLARM